MKKVLFLIFYNSNLDNSDRFALLNKICKHVHFWPFYKYTHSSNIFIFYIFFTRFLVSAKSKMVLQNY